MGIVGIGKGAMDGHRPCHSLRVAVHDFILRAMDYLIDMGPKNINKSNKAQLKRTQGPSLITWTGDITHQIIIHSFDGVTEAAKGTISTGLVRDIMNIPILAHRTRTLFIFSCYIYDYAGELCGHSSMSPFCILAFWRFWLVLPLSLWQPVWGNSLFLHTHTQIEVTFSKQQMCSFFSPF